MGYITQGLAGLLIGQKARPDPIFSIGMTNGKSEPWGQAARTTVAAMIGGTASRATGGKFANGAISSAVAWTLNTETNIAQEEFKSRVGISKERFIKMSPDEQDAHVKAKISLIKLREANRAYQIRSLNKSLKVAETGVLVPQGDDPMVVMATTATEIVKMLPIPGGTLGTVIAQPVQGAAIYVGTKKGEEMLRNENR